MPDTIAAVDFLQKFHGDNALWLLCRKTEDGMHARCFDVHQHCEVAGWINETPHADYYHQIAQPKTLANKKPGKEDIASCNWLWAEVDPEPGETEDQCIERVRKLQPTVLIASGRGAWALLKLRKAVVGAHAALIEKRNSWLKQQVNGDDCQNIDRLSRLPGTINSKTGKIARVIEWNTSLEYSIEDIAEVESEVATPATTSPEFAEIDAIAWDDINPSLQPDGVRPELSAPALSLALYAVRDPSLLDGKNPRDLDHSTAMVAFAGQALRDGASIKDVCSLLANESLAISAHIYNKYGKAKRVYSREQKLKAIKRAVRRAIATEQMPGGSSGFDCGDNGLPRANQQNVRLAIQKLSIELESDEFTGRLLCRGAGLGPDLGDAELDRLWLTIEQKFRFRAGYDYFCKIVQDEARLNSFHPIRDYLTGLVWDETSRLDTWLHKYGGAADTPFVRAVGAIVLIAAVRRVREPGCQFDEMLVLESDQGKLKSSAMAVLATRAEWFSDDLPLGADSKVFIERTRGHWIIEAAELNGMKKRDVEQLKASLSRRVDRARMAFGRATLSVPRQCIVIGTTNSKTYLRDGTGNRRFWPVEVRQFDLDALKRDRDQLWAEAAHREATGESIRLDPSLWSAAGEQQDERRVEDPFVDRLQAALGDHNGKLRALDAWEIVGVPPGQQTQDHNQRLGEAMRKLGFERTKLRFGGTNPEHAYVRGAKGHGERERRILVNPDGHSTRIEGPSP